MDENWQSWDGDQDRGGIDPRDDYIRDFDGKMRSRYVIQQRIQEQHDAMIQAMFHRQAHPEIRRREIEQALRANPLLEHQRENKKRPRSLGGLGKCYICNHPQRAKIEELYRRKEGWNRGNMLGVYRDIVAAGCKVSLPACCNHFKKHYQAPDGQSGADGTNDTAGVGKG